MTVTKFSSDDISAAFGNQSKTIKCATCSHSRWKHRVEVITPGLFNRVEETHECEWRDRRTTTGKCKCTEFKEKENG